MTTTLTSKGQVTVPKKFRDYLGLRPGAAVSFTLGPHGEVIVAPAAAAGTPRDGNRLRKLLGTMDTGTSSDVLMQHLRGYDDDARDPGFT